MSDRRPDWEPRLLAYLEKVRDKPHVYGKHDCMLFVADVVKSQTGKDPAWGHRGKYTTRLGSAKYLKTLGFNSPEAMLDSLFEEKPIGFAQRGDIALCALPDPDNPEVIIGIPGVCFGSDALIVGQHGESEGLVRIPRVVWLKAWAV